MPTLPATPVDPVRWRLPLPGQRCLELGHRPLVMGILNLTPDSFSDGGLFSSPEDAVRRGLEMLEEGADLLDLGAESTRPGGSAVYGKGARTLSAKEELERLLPVLQPLRHATDAILSVDTRKGEVARAALQHGADLINDVGGLGDIELSQAVAQAGVPAVVMHSRGEIATMQRDIRFADVCGEVADELLQVMRAAESHGVAPEQLILDPGIGFGKTAQGNLQLLADLGPLAELGRPLLIGASRKSFIAAVHPSPPPERLAGSLAAVAAAAAQGAAILRVHDVAATVQFLTVSNAIHLAAEH